MVICIEAPVDSSRSIQVQAAPRPLEAGSRSGIRMDRRGKAWENRWENRWKTWGKISKIYGKHGEN